MNVRTFFTPITLVLLAGCTSIPLNQTDTSPSTTNEVVMTPTEITRPTEDNLISTDSSINLVDLTGFAAAWSTHDAAVIRALYKDDARYFSDEDLEQFAREEPEKVLVSEETFLDQVHKFDGYTMRILDKPIGIYGKLVAFAYRWEKPDKTGYNGMGLLRNEGEQIFLHIDMVSTQQTPGDDGGFTSPSAVDFDNLMRSWNDADMTLAKTLYSENAIVLSDEDLAQTSWRDYNDPPQLKELFTQFAGWNPVLISEPIQIEDMILFAWRWNRPGLEYPIGYGMRLLKVTDSLIIEDVRIAIRPWEKNGNLFVNP